MADLILHHYPLSPFAEKIRLILGMKGLVWRSVVLWILLFGMLTIANWLGR